MSECKQCGKPITRKATTGLCLPCIHKGLKRAMPDTFPADAMEMKLADLQLKYRASPTTVNRWLSENNIERPIFEGGCNGTPVPSDFREREPGATIYELAAHYGVSRHVINRWRRVIGLTPRYDRDARGKTKPKPFKLLPGVPKPGMQVHRDWSPAGQAADFLRRFSPVIRCNEKGQYEQHGSHWRRGSTILTPDDVMQRATAQGWTPSL